MSDNRIDDELFNDVLDKLRQLHADNKYNVEVTCEAGADAFYDSPPWVRYERNGTYAYTFKINGGATKNDRIDIDRLADKIEEKIISRLQHCVNTNLTSKEVL